MTLRKLGFALFPVIAIAVGVSLALAGPNDESKRGKPTTKAAPSPKCPVMGEAIDFSVQTMTKDGPVYFCCKPCIKDYNDKPEKFADKVIAQRKALAALPKIQVLCPVTGKPIDEKVAFEWSGEQIRFCCKGCVAKFKKAPAKYKAKLAGSYSYQTICPVMGKEINPGVSTKLYNGMNLYYCCKGCDKKFRKDPAKYVANLKKQGIRINPKKVKGGDSGKGKSGHSHDHGHHGHDH